MSLSLPEELIIGVAELDEQHRLLYAEINRLHDAMKEHRLEQVLATAEYLERYAKEHFASEERLMIESGHPGFPEHLTAHNEFKRHLAAWRARLAGEGPSAHLVVELSSWLTGWLRDHIRKLDAAFAQHLRGRGTRHG